MTSEDRAVIPDLEKGRTYASLGLVFLVLEELEGCSWLALILDNNNDSLFYRGGGTFRLNQRSAYHENAIPF